MGCVRGSRCNFRSPWPGSSRPSTLKPPPLREGKGVGGPGRARPRGASTRNTPKEVAKTPTPRRESRRPDGKTFKLNNPLPGSLRRALSNRDEVVELHPDEPGVLARHGNACIADWPGLGVDAADTAGQDLAGERQAPSRNDAGGNGRTRDVPGQTIARPVFAVSAAGETTRAGLFPTLGPVAVRPV